MAKKNTIINAGLNGLLAPARSPEGQTAPADPVEEQAKKPYKTVCYSIPADLAEKIRYIAYWDRKKLNAVVSEAFAAYCAAWNPTTDVKPKKI